MAGPANTLVRRSRACTCSACSSRTGSSRRRTRPTWPTSTSSRSRPSRYDAEAARRPDDTWQIAASHRPGTEQDAAKAFLEFWAKGSTQVLNFKNAPGAIPTAKDADQSTFTDLQKKAATIVGSAKRITQFLDRDTRADFAGSNGMQSFLQKFLANPTQDLAAFQKTIQDFWTSLPPLS